jgi:hypothetical protein
VFLLPIFLPIFAVQIGIGVPANRDRLRHLVSIPSVATSLKSPREGALSTSRINWTNIEAYFGKCEDKAFSRSDLIAIFETRKSDWILPKSMGPKAFLEMIIRHTKMSERKLQSMNYPELLRYVWGANVSPIAVANSIKHDAYFTHGSAMWIHGIGSAADEIYINSEQSKKPTRPVVLTQAAIDRAFRNRQRTSKLIYRFNNATITVLSGKNSGRLEVKSANAPSGERVDVTSLERTLIDITVRPAYAGGIAQVLKAFQAARERVSIQKLLGVLKHLDYAYPFHQAIGFFMKRSAYPAREQGQVKNLAMSFDFYLEYGMADSAFDNEFKVFYPRSLDQG